MAEKTSTGKVNKTTAGRRKKSTRKDSFVYEDFSSAFPTDFLLPGSGYSQRASDADAITTPSVPKLPPTPARASAVKHETQESASPLVKQLELEKLKQTNLQLELEISNKKLQLAMFQDKISTPEDKIPVHPTDSSVQLQSSNMDQLFQIPTLSDLREKRVQDKWLPHKYIVSTKGVLEYKDLELSDFVLGFLEMIKDVGAEDTGTMLNYLSLLMEKAGSYTWPSVRNFHLAISKVIDSGRIKWSNWEFLRARASTAFSHADLISANVANVDRGFSNSKSNKLSTTFKPPNSSLAKESYCKPWNYEGVCKCSKSCPDYKASHKCKVCDLSDHPMLSCKKRRWPVPSLNSQSSYPKLE